MAKLNQIIAIEKGVKSRNCSTISDLYKKIQKQDLFNGFSKKYSSKDEDGESYPDEKRKVVLNVVEMLEEFKISMSELLDVTATKDYGNCKAYGTIIVDSNILVADVPASNLLFLEKQIIDVKTFVENLPVLDESEDWIKDVNSNLFKTDSIVTHKSKKVQKPIVLYEATDRHPAQTQMITEDITIGYWNTIKQSGGLPLPEKKKLLEKINKLTKAIKFAREEANNTEIENKNVGEKILGFLLD